MSRSVFEIELNDQSVKVRLITSERSPRGRFYAILTYFLWIALGLLFGTLLPGKHGTPNMWHHLSSAQANSGIFLFDWMVLLGTFTLVVLTSWHSWVAANPSDQIFSCDRSTLTISIVRWFDFHNQDWETRSYALQEITKMKYGCVARGRGGAVYGLCFTARGETQAILPGVKLRAADRILKALKALGVDVPEDPKLQTMLAESASIPDNVI